MFSYSAILAWKTEFHEGLVVDVQFSDTQNRFPVALTYFHIDWYFCLWLIFINITEESFE